MLIMHGICVKLFKLDETRDIDQVDVKAESLIKR